MHKDRYGLACTGSAVAVQRLSRAQEHLLRFRPEVIQELDAAIAEDADCVMARAARAWIGLMSSEWPDARAVAELVAGKSSIDAREQAHLDAIRTWASGDMHACGRLLDALLEAHPRDALALYAGHQIDFFCGDAVNLRDRIVRARRGWDTQHPDFATLDGMLAFGLEECGDYARAEDIGRRAVERNADDVWAIHAVVHVLEMQARFDEGIAFLEARRANWAEGNFLNVHNGWHLAVFLLALSPAPIFPRARQRAGPNFLGTPWARMGTVPIRARGWPVVRHVTIAQPDTRPPRALKLSLRRPVCSANLRHLAISSALDSVAWSLQTGCGRSPREGE